MIGARADGDLEAWLAGLDVNLALVATRAVGRASEGLRDELRGQVAAARLGSGLAHAWRSRQYPGGRPSLGAAGVVYTKAPTIHAAFAADTLIAATGRFLVIPSPEAVAMGFGRAPIERGSLGRFSRGSGRSGGQLGKAIRRLGAETLARVPLADGRILIVYRPPAPGARARGGKRFRNLQLPTSTRSVPLFVLQKTVRIRQRLDIEGPAKRWYERMWSDVAGAIGG